ncbi:Embryo-specific protein ats3 [Thalictrum thalictroides]|uniref:Embryo-specific protein ats3 n=1 Tax=Thalictrum thalictroides TaxID=46969 RepID=A0A7J6WH67_THATH|nr:Embryo-specific protein ats3 [Thalictrum thalictroides]
MGSDGCKPDSAKVYDQNTGTVKFNYNTFVPYGVWFGFNFFTIKTSCSSTSFTRDQISLAFGDAYGNQVYAKRIDDPSSRTFERCSTDTFQIYGPCMHGKICHLYLYRMGSDGWKPDSVKIYDRNTGTVKFNYNTFVPYGVWFGFNFCNSIDHNDNVNVSVA